MDDTIRWLLGNKDFHEYAAGVFRERGLQPPANPGREFLVALREVDPQRFQALVQTPVAHLEQVRQQYIDRGARLEKLHTSGLPARAAEEWKKLDESHGLRAQAKRPEIVARAKQLFRESGFGPLPGMSEAETLLAFVHAGEGNEELLAQVAPSVFGHSATDARSGMAKIRGWHQTDTTAQAIGEAQQKRNVELNRRRAVPGTQPVYDKKNPPPGAITPKDKKPVDTRSGVAEAFEKQRTIAGPRRVTVTNRKELDDRQFRNRYAPADHREIDFGPELKHELVQELRDEQFVNEAHAKSTVVSSDGGAP